MKTHEAPWRPMKAHDDPWKPIKTHEITWIHMNSPEVPWKKNWHFVPLKIILFRLFCFLGLPFVFAFFLLNFEMFWVCYLCCGNIEFANWILFLLLFVLLFFCKYFVVFIFWPFELVKNICCFVYFFSGLLFVIENFLLTIELFWPILNLFAWICWKFFQFERAFNLYVLNKIR